MTEARGDSPGDRMYGEHRLCASPAGCARMPTEAVAERVRTPTAQRPGGSRHDDTAAPATTRPTTGRGRLHPVDGPTARSRAAQDRTEEEGA
ncbi:hypothetical protein ACF09K_32615 [Streptomyces sp. NPDC014882]|uniref:hypothetical protein n=1 Tax=Streptomyces sp. NPDC014882 TaxID=3364927 RepID=UPI0036FBDF51